MRGISAIPVILGWVGFGALPFVVTILYGISFYTFVSDVYVGAFVTASSVFLGFLINALFRADIKFSNAARSMMIVNIV